VTQTPATGTNPLVEPAGNNMWKVTVYGIQKETHLKINFRTSNAEVTGCSVYSAGNSIYITSAMASTASVYSVTGALIKTITLRTGETGIVDTQAGIYIVALNKKAYKVIVK
jgi:hypothetical protein